MTLAEDIALLTRVPLFADLAGDQLRLLAFSAIRLELPAGRVLFRAESKALSGFVVMTGEIELSHHKGEETVPLGRFGPGVLIGEMALFVETKRPATATAVVDSEVVEIDGTLMRRMLTEYPDIAVKIFSKLRGRLGETLSELGGVEAKLDALHYPGPAKR
ncbi:cyclic nucleotide-binding protein [Kaistia algarum]|uniref:Crp/Fnr family transcriptional regulator n=1 Tax=Kaistia algarum TaxID=2083279 RepID=UPI000CE79B55|nr:Crp/Fnr family transcriptional regulator [Kaistia algarum]MCX5513876.1 Crp/Fnr family transcriptional regulator [Kaistia algarum]PPE79268.1 cyclic nucleotide-binding protein [Kaistia algarum]